MLDSKPVTNGIQQIRSVNTNMFATETIATSASVIMQLPYRLVYSSQGQSAACGSHAAQLAF